MKKSRVSEKYMPKRRYLDYPMLFIVMFLVGFGLVMIFSTSSYKSTLNFGNPYHWLIRQCFAVAVGAVFMAVLTWFDYRILNTKVIAYGCYGLSVALLIIVLFIGAAKKGAVRWISIGGFQFQPSEVAKIFLVIYLAYILSKNAHRMRTMAAAVKVIVRCLPIIGLVAYQNLSTAIVLTAMVGVMIFVVSPKTKELLGIALSGVAGLVLYLTFSNSYRNERVAIWKNPETHPFPGCRSL